MPLSGKAIVIDPVRRTEGQSAVGAADKHHVSGRSPGWQHTAQHIDIVVSRTPGAVNREEDLACQAFGINRARI